MTNLGRHMQPGADIGFLEGFQGADTLLIVADASSLHRLAETFLALTRPGAQPVAMHQLPFVRAHGIALTASVAEVDSGLALSGLQFHWVRSSEGWLAVHGLVEGLHGASRGHQYLSGPADPFVTMLSVGEYDDGLWQGVD